MTDTAIPDFGFYPEDHRYGRDPFPGDFDHAHMYGDIRAADGHDDDEAALDDAAWLRLCPECGSNRIAPSDPVCAACARLADMAETVRAMNLEEAERDAREL